MRWIGTPLSMNGKRIDLPEYITIPLWDKIKVRALIAHGNVKYNIMVKQGNTWYAPEMRLEISSLLNKKKSD